MGSVCPRGLIRDDPDICETPVLAAVLRAVQAFCISIGVMAGLVVRCDRGVKTDRARVASALFISFSGLCLLHAPANEQDLCHITSPDPEKSKVFSYVHIIAFA